MKMSKQEWTERVRVLERMIEAKRSEVTSPESRSADMKSLRSQLSRAKKALRSA